jgi:diguanylate cyclase (GGDEF)-like protein
MIAGGNAFEFAICIFDCNNLKFVNDSFGHDKGDIYLKKTSGIICEVFDHCPVFRIGGDEFAAIIQGNEYGKRTELIRQFDEKCSRERSKNTEAWEQVSVARGLAEYDPSEDKSVDDVIRRADRNMYENKWNTKEERR